MARRYWEDNGWSTEWAYHQYRLRCHHLDGAEVARLVQKFGEPAMTELGILAGTGNFNAYIPVFERLTAAKAAEPTADLPLFASL
jgi:hypothetical protein